MQKLITSELKTLICLKLTGAILEEGFVLFQQTGQIVGEELSLVHLTNSSEVM
ncbi:hypothetical protein ABE021_13550 [Sporosarcina gallistercoris]|uniref:hypothetical protein n=1 Tax=Sporosarcina gallistercoris TaxID=2762245 RepID=UPI003D2CAB04